MTNYFTRNGYIQYIENTIKLEGRLKDLQSNVQEYAETGGNMWHDNFSYENLRRQIGDVSNNIAKMNEALHDCKIVEIPKSVDSVVIGCEITIKRSNVIEKYQILGYGESDPKNGKMAYNTPFAQLIMGKKVGYRFENQNLNPPQIIELLGVNPIKEN